jgi:hypothetical protein
MYSRRPCTHGTAYLPDPFVRCSTYDAGRSAESLGITASVIVPPERIPVGRCGRVQSNPERDADDGQTYDDLLRSSEHSRHQETPKDELRVRGHKPPLFRRLVL